MIVQTIILFLAIFSILLPTNVQAKYPKSRFNVQFGVGPFFEDDENGEPDPETGEMPSNELFSSMISVGYTSYFYCSRKKGVCLTAAPKLQLSSVWSKENEHLFGAHLGIGFSSSHPLSVRVIGGYGFSVQNGATPIFGVEFSVLTFLYVTLVNDTNNQSFISFGIDILTLITIFNRISENQQTRKQYNAQNPDPGATSPIGSNPDQNTLDFLNF
jgi:hypothetical protein